MKILGKLIFAIIVLLALVIVGRNVIIKAGAEMGVKKVTGLSLDIGTFSMGLKETNINIEDFRLQNPSEFKEKTMLNVPKVYVDYNLKPMLAGKVHLKDVQFHLEEFVLVKNADGTTNLDSLKAIKAGKEAKATDKPKDSQTKPNIQIDNFHLKIGRVRFVEYDAAGKATEKTFNINLDEEHSDIQDINKVVTLIIFKALAKTPLGLAGLGLGGLENVLGGTLGTATDLIGTTSGTATKALDEATGAVTDTADKLKGMIKSPFGKK